MVAVFVILLEISLRWILRRVRSKKVAAATVILPHDIILEILSNMPLKFLLRFKCVSKSWNFILSDPHFIQLLHRSDIPSIVCYRKLYYEHRAFNIFRFNNKHYSPSDVHFYIPWQVSVMYPYCEILGICNGLICVQLSNFWEKVPHLILWNPLTMQFRDLPKCPYRFTKENVRFSYGFGYDGLTDDYKLVAAAGEYSKTELFVYSVKSNTWGSGRVHDIEMWMLANEKGIHLNGILHWIAPPVVVDFQVTTFDLATEDIGKIWLPKLHPVFAHCIYLGALSGWLCFWYYHKDSNLGGSLMDTDDLMIDVWVMKEYGVVSSWTKLLVVRPEIEHGCMPTQDVFVPFLLSKEHEVVCISNRKINIRSLISQDVTRWYLTGLGCFWTMCYSFPYTESLVPIGSTKKRESERNYSFLKSFLEFLFFIIGQLTI